MILDWKTFEQDRTRETTFGARLLCSTIGMDEEKIREIHKISGRRRSDQRSSRTTRGHLLEANFQATTFGGGS